MKRKIFILSFFALLSLSSYAEIVKPHKLRMRLDDTFVVRPNKNWNIDIEKELSLRFANVYITPKKGYDFSMMLYFKCDTKDLAQYDSSWKIKKRVYLSSKLYLPYCVSKKIKMKYINVKGWYGWYTVLEDKELAMKSKIPNGEFKYITRGMIRLSPSSALGFSLMTNEINTEKYNKMFNYIKSFVKERENCKRRL